MFDLPRLSAWRDLPFFKGMIKVGVEEGLVAVETGDLGQPLILVLSNA